MLTHLAVGGVSGGYLLRGVFVEISGDEFAVIKCQWGYSLGNFYDGGIFADESG